MAEDAAPSGAVRPQTPLGVPRDHLPGDAAPSPMGFAPPIPDEPDDEDEEGKPRSHAPRRGTFTILATIWLACWFGVMFLVLNHRFDRKMDWNTSYFSIAARNLVRDGFINLRGGIYLTAGQGFELSQKEFYAGHPPLTAWVLAAWMKVMGYHGQPDWVAGADWKIRLLPLIFTTLNLALLWLLVRRVFGAAGALAVMVIFSVLPMVAFYGQNVNMEPFTMTFILGASLGYLGWARSRSRVALVWMCICVVLGCWTDWPMYLFSGFLGVLHLFRWRDMIVFRSDGTPDSADGEKARRGWLTTLTLVVIPVLMFGAFVGYLRLNGAQVRDLVERATERRGVLAEGEKPDLMAGYRVLGQKFRWVKDRRPDMKAIEDFKTWFVDLFTPAALVLFVIGALTWRSWSRRMAITSGEVGRRAMFRIVVCFILMQLTYTLAFPQGAWTHEFWQYYLSVPVAVLAGGLLVGLTLAGGEGRRFRYGFFDRLGWAVAALIPLMAIGPMGWRLHLPAPEEHGKGLHFEISEPLKQHTRPGDVILCDLPDEPVEGSQGVQKALPWYSDRYILADGMAANLVVAAGGKLRDDGRTTTDVESLGRILKGFAGRRIIYLWKDEGGEQFFRHLNTTYPRYEIPLAGGQSMIFYLLQGQAAPEWRRAGIQGGPGTRPSTAPATTRAAG
jgi:hypothetical protein